MKVWHIFWNIIQQVLDYRDDSVQKKFPDNQKKSQSLIIGIMVLRGIISKKSRESRNLEFLINPGIARITVIKVPIIKDLLYKFVIFFEKQCQLVIIFNIIASLSYFQKSVPAWHKYGKLDVISNFTVSFRSTSLQ